jgi:hypothetical protein
MTCPDSRLLAAVGTVVAQSNEPMPDSRALVLTVQNALEPLGVKRAPLSLLGILYNYRVGQHPFLGPAITVKLNVKTDTISVEYKLTSAAEVDLAEQAQDAIADELLSRHHAEVHFKTERQKCVVGPIGL